MASNYPSPLMPPSITGSVHLGMLGHPNFVSHHSPPPSLPDSLHILSWITIPSPHPPVIADAYQHFECTLLLFLLVIYKPNPSLPLGYRCQYIAILLGAALIPSKTTSAYTLIFQTGPESGLTSSTITSPPAEVVVRCGIPVNVPHISRNLPQWSSLRIRVSERRSYISLPF